MYYLAIIYGIIFFILGYLLKISQNSRHIKQEEDFYFQFKKFRYLAIENNHNYKKSNSFIIKNESIFINSNINEAIQEIFDIIILDYINSWYLGFSNNEDFIVEIKYFFHMICAEILIRFSKIDIVGLVSQKFLPAFINHLDICYTIQNSNNDNSNSHNLVQELMLQKMRSHLHVAMISRGNELAYLRSISKFLIPKITPDYFSPSKNKICDHLLQECLSGTVLLPAMDSFASPDFINRCIYLMMVPLTAPPTPTSVSLPGNVPILHRYQTAWTEKLKRHTIHPKGIDCLRNEKYFYPFLQYIKTIDAVTPINLYMEMDAITLKLLIPGMDENTKVHVFQDIERLENLLQSADEFNNLNISNLHQRIKEVIADGYMNVDKLRNCKIWMENYQLISQLLKSLYLAQYFESEYFLSTIYGNRQSDIDSSDTGKSSSVTKFGNTFNNSDDSLNYNSGDVNNDTVDDSGPRWFTNSLGELVDLPDLSNFRVKILSISQISFNHRNKNELCFSVSTFKVDSENALKKVHRKYGDFYALEQKLLEFHGGSIARNLPAKKPWDNKNLDFLEKCKPQFETYLMYLVSRSFLKNSELLHRFLFQDTFFIDSTLIDINLGRFVKSMPIKLAKEKGQFLDQFLNNFHLSCESSSQNKQMSNNDINSSTSTSSSDSVKKSIIDTRMHTRMFWNNAELNTVKSEGLINDTCSFSTRHIFYFYDTLCYLFEIITNKITYSRFIINLLFRIRPIAFGILQSYVTNIISRGIEKLCHDKVAVNIINNLRDVALVKGINRTDNEKLERRKEALKCFHDIIPEWLKIVIPNDQMNNIYSNIDRIFEYFQQPKLNKQLSYVLFDILLQELFPELTENIAHINNEMLRDK